MIHNIRTDRKNSIQIDGFLRINMKKVKETDKENLIRYNSVIYIFNDSAIRAEIPRINYDNL
jgi:hypothetical protein